MINQNKRLPAAPIMVAPDPFVDLGILSEGEIGAIVRTFSSAGIPKSTKGSGATMIGAAGRRLF